ncbi:MAG: Ig-like domain-containing protein, partial [Sedimentisphaerales bacterium]
MKRTFHQHGLIAWSKRKKAKAMAKMEERLKAESQARLKAEERLKAEIEARASVEQKVKAEAEKMLLTQYRNYSVMVERVEAQAKKEIAAAKAQAKEAVEKARSYAEALAQAEEKLTKAQEQAKTEALARAKAEEELKLERQERQSIEARAKEEIAAARAQAEEKVRSYPAALAQAEEKLTKAQEKPKTEAMAMAKADESLKAERKEPQSIEAQPAETIKTFKRIHRHVFRPRTIKRIFALISALAILSAIAFAVVFAVSTLNNPPVAEPGSAMTQEDKSVPITLMGSDPDGKHLTYNVVTGPSHGSLSGTAPNMTYTPALNYNGPDSFTFRVNDGKANSNQAMISVTVLAVNDAPIANPQSQTTKENKSVSAALTGSDVDGDPSIFIICKEPQHGKLTFDSNFNTNGRLIYTPEPHFTGPDIFTFKLNDGEVDSAPATVSINVAPNLLPVAEPHSATT